MSRVPTVSANADKSGFRAYRSPIRGVDGSLYMDRFVFQTPWFTLRLHHIMRPDAATDLHDHPWWFLSLLLTGSYIEQIPIASRLAQMPPERMIQRVGDDVLVRRPRCSIVEKSATDLHRIVELPDGPIWTLVLSGPYERKWGFQTKNGWIYWRDHPSADTGAQT